MRIRIRDLVNPGSGMGGGGCHLPEVDEGGPGMGLNPGVGRVVHEEQEAGHHARVELLLEDGREVRRHLTNGVAAGVPHPTHTTIQYTAVCFGVLQLQPVLRIHEILVRIRIPGSVPLTNGTGSCYFRQ
jgi:hypothetical protein